MSQTVAQLRVEAKRRGLAYAGLRKAELLTLLEGEGEGKTELATPLKNKHEEFIMSQSVAQLRTEAKRLGLVYTGLRKAELLKLLLLEGGEYEENEGPQPTQKTTRQSIIRKEVTTSAETETPSLTVKTEPLVMMKTEPLVTVKTEPLVAVKKAALWLKGPVSLSEHKGPDKRVYVFGDYHVKNGVCPPGAEVVTISDFISNTLVTNATQTIDLFVEVAYARGPKTAQILAQHDPSRLPPAYLVDIQSLFRQCWLDTDRKECKKRWPNLRFHHLDIRDLAGTGIDQTLLIFVWEAAAKLQNAINTADATWPDASILTPLLLPSGIYGGLDLGRDIFKPWTPERIRNLLRLTKIEKQLDKIPSIQQRKVIEETAATRWNQWSDVEYNDAVEAIWALRKWGFPLLTKKATTMKPKSKTKILEIQGWIAAVAKVIRGTAYNMAILLDLYTVARLLRPYVERAMIYVGEGHARGIRPYLEALGMVELASVSARTKTVVPFQCVDLSGFHVPFFQ
jgi:hypothetical protein